MTDHARPGVVPPDPVLPAPSPPAPAPPNAVPPPTDAVPPGRSEGLCTPRLILRRFRPQDGVDLHSYLGDEETVRFEPYGPFTAEQARAEAVRRSEDPAFLAVVHAAENRVIGNLWFAEQDDGTHALGYVFHRGYAGRGFATEAARALVDTAFRVRGVRRVVAHCNPENERSWRLLDRLGFRREGHLIQNVFFRRDDAGRPLWQDTFEYAVLSAEWRGVAPSPQAPEQPSTEVDPHGPR